MFFYACQSVSHKGIVVLVVVVRHLFFIRLGGGDLDWGLLAGHVSLSTNGVNLL